MSLIQLGDFTLHSGAKSRFKLECDALTDDDWQALAYLVWQMVGRFGSVEGVPRGGLKLAAALEQYRCRDLDGSIVVAAAIPLPLLLVDDVLTTGRSMQRIYDSFDWPNAPEGLTAIGAVVFARGPCPPWVRAVFTLPERLWLPRD